MLGVYFTLANFDPFHRATLDNLQLLLLCQKLISNILTMRKCSLKWYQTLETWRQLDWIYMETFLRQQSLLVIIWGRITFGDVTENFSISPNFCQYCHITRRKLDNLEHHAPVFTVKEYNNTVQELQNNDASKSEVWNLTLFLILWHFFFMFASQASHPVLAMICLRV